jgi:hypothetical protein
MIAIGGGSSREHAALILPAEDSRGCSLIIYAIVVVFGLMAIHNVLIWLAVIPSVIWLLFIGYFIVSECKRVGIRTYLANIAGRLAPHHFLEHDDDDLSGREVVRYGFTLFNHDVTQWQLPICDITAVEWSAGQASGMTGRDMDDWHVFIWFRDGKEGYSRRPGERCHSLTPARPRIITETDGKVVGDYLITIGAPLRITQDGQYDRV